MRTGGLRPGADPSPGPSADPSPGPSADPSLSGSGMMGSRMTSGKTMPVMSKVCGDPSRAPSADPGADPSLGPSLGPTLNHS